MSIVRSVLRGLLGSGAEVFHGGDADERGDAGESLDRPQSESEDEVQMGIVSQRCCGWHPSQIASPGNLGMLRNSVYVSCGATCAPSN